MKIFTLGVVAEYFDALKLLNRLIPPQTNKLIIWLGSSIGNFNRSEARYFLTHIRETLTPSDHILLGIDLKKDTKYINQSVCISHSLILCHAMFTNFVECDFLILSIFFV
jgi:uncharacterized SAM-dependent methyltransferase